MCQSDIHAAAGRGVLEGVVDQVGQRPLQAAAVACQRMGRGESVAEGDAVRLGHALEQFHRLMSMEGMPHVSQFDLIQ